MKAEQIESQMDQVFNTVKDVQKKVSLLRRQAITLVKENEVKARNSLHKVFDGGLTLLGQGMILGRKATESFVAETHRKAKKLVQREQPEELSIEVSEVIPAEIQASKKNKKKAKVQVTRSVNPNAKIKNKLRSGRAHLTAAARSH